MLICPYDSQDSKFISYSRQISTMWNLDRYLVHSDTNVTPFTNLGTFMLEFDLAEIFCSKSVMIPMEDMEISIIILKHSSFNTRKNFAANIVHLDVYFMPI